MEEKASTQEFGKNLRNGNYAFIINTAKNSNDHYKGPMYY